jgi:hypothetical protein
MRRIRQGAHPKAYREYGEDGQRSRGGCSGGRMPGYPWDTTLGDGGGVSDREKIFLTHLSSCAG